MSMSRRDFLKGFAASVSAVAIGGVPGVAHAERHTIIWGRRNGEAFQADIATTEGYNTLRHLLRDVRAGKVGYPHYFLLERIAWMQAWLALYQRHEIIEFTSGLRMPSTNARTEGAKQNSAHLPNFEGVFFAADWKMRGVDAVTIARLSKGLSEFAGYGGTGLYFVRDFVHTDVMRKREWQGR